jgi:hypothetical protein
MAVSPLVFLSISVFDLGRQALDENVRRQESLHQLRPFERHKQSAPE